MQRRSLVLPFAAALLALAPTAAVAADADFTRPDAPGPALSVPVAKLDAALACSPGIAGATRAPVLLFQGTGARAQDNWAWTYQPAFTKRGIPHCTVDLPDQATSDVQVAGEYVVHAIRTVSARAGRKVALVGHSQGGMVTRWALRFWPDTRAMVDDVIGFAPSNHGTTLARDCQAEGGCSAASTQQADTSNFIRALNSYAETWAGIDYTVAYTRTDETVLPNQDEATGSSSLRTGEGRRRNVAIQDVCPGAVYEHLAIGTVEPVAYALALDALDNPGPADPARVPLTACAEPYHEGVNTLTVAFDAAAAAASFASYQPRTVPREPALACYVVASCRASGTPAAPVALAKRCRSNRRFTVRFPALRSGSKATLGGKGLKLRRSGRRSVASVDLRGRSKAVVVLKVRGRTVTGKRFAQTRRYRTCG